MQVQLGEEPADQRDVDLRQRGFPGAAPNGASAMKSAARPESSRVAVVAAASIYLQVGIGTSVWLGANLTTAALLLAGVVVAAGTRRYVAQRTSEHVRAT